MKISLITIWHVGNYGAEMQSYATIKTLQEMGYDVHMIDIRLTDALPGTLKYKVASLVECTSLLHHKFEKFWKQYIPTTKRYHNVRELQSNPLESDVYMVGSDQVWNPDLTTTLARAYFLDFGKSSVRRIAYAASFGFSDFQDETLFKETYGNLLHKIDAISCREETGVRLLHKLGIDATTVLDPTLLRNDYTELTGEIKEKQLLVYYPVGNKLESVESFAKQMAEQLNLSYINLMQRHYMLGRFFCNGLSIQDWLRSIASSQMVITTSFHGVAISLVYQRQFIAIISNPSRGSRITNLLDRLGLSDRYFYSVDDAMVSECWKSPINYSKVYDKLITLRKKSLDFLKQAIDGK